MARRGLASKVRLTIRSALNRLKSVTPILVIVLVVAAIGIGVWFARPYFDDMLSLVPGYYQNDEYNSLTEDKNALIEKNAKLLAQTEELEAQLGGVAVTAAGYQTMIDLNSQNVEILTTIEQNLSEILEIDDSILGMRLPDVVSTYVQTSASLDEIRFEMIGRSIKINEARRDSAAFNKTRAEFDACIGAIKWAGSDKSISAGITTCSEKITAMQTQLAELEGTYGVELEETANYLLLLKEEWEASSSYYSMISQRNYTKANQYDAVFVDRKRKISELDLIAVLNEFHEEAIVPLLDEFTDLAGQEVEKERAANEWYDEHIER